MLALITIQMGLVQGETYWTIYPNSPVLHPVTWGDELVLVSVNNSWILGGHPGSDESRRQQSALFSYSGRAVDPPLCGVQQPMDGCLLLG